MLAWAHPVECHDADMYAIRTHGTMFDMKFKCVKSLSNKD